MNNAAQALTARNRRGSGTTPLSSRLQGPPPQSFFLVSAVFHYLGPALAVLLFAHLDVMGVAWLRIATAAALFAMWRRPWRLLARMDWRGRVVLLATAGAKTPRNAVALALTVGGVAALTDMRLAGQPLGFAFAFGNCALFMCYVVLGHRVANTEAGTGAMSGIDQLGAAMLVAVLVVTPVGLGGALAAFAHPMLLLAGLGVGLCSSVIPYVTDQLAMARLPRATFSLMLALLPMMGTVIGAIVLRQLSTG
jgi:inner membrane transporter RhtA